MAKQHKIRPPEKLRIFTYHGVGLEFDSKEANGDCPYCGKEYHFYVETQTGKWHCKTCNESGNIPVFLNRLIEVSSEHTKRQAYVTLAKERGLKYEFIRKAGLVQSFLLPNVWLMPAYNAKGKLSNVYKCVKIDGKWKVMSSPTCKLHPFGVDKLDRTKKTAHIAEGLWDYLAMFQTIHTITGSTAGKLAASVNCLGAPGSGWFA